MSPRSGPDVLTGTLDTARWSYTTHTFRALGHRFAVRSTDDDLGRLFDGLYRPCAVPGQPDTWYSVVTTDPESLQRELYVDDQRVGCLDRPSWLVRWLTWHVNHRVIECTDDHVLLHAAVAARDGVGVVLPAASEAGKTTLVAGLVRAGYDYLSDEAAAIDPATLQIAPYPKPLAIDRGSWEVLADFAPDEAEVARGYHERQWLVNPASVRPDAISGPVPASIVVFPRFERGAATTCEPVRRSEALLEALRHTFRFHDAGRRNLEVLARTLRGAYCYRLVTGNLTKACVAIDELTAAAAEDDAGEGA